MPPKNILVAVDGSDHAQNAVAFADDLAEKCGAHLTLLHVSQSVGSYRIPEDLKRFARIEHVNITESDLLRAEAEHVLDEASASITRCEGKRLRRELRAGDVTGEIVDYARGNGIDLIVIGSRGLSDLGGLLLGSVSHKVTQLADCPCLLVR
jgi:nucleotide-binding universal stress UspA family protein